MFSDQVSSAIWAVLTYGTDIIQRIGRVGIATLLMMTVTMMVMIVMTVVMSVWINSVPKSINESECSVVSDFDPTPVHS